MSPVAAPELEVRPLHVVQGEHRIADDPRVVLSTVLGSCVAACIRDPVAGVGGMNHFLLPGDRREHDELDAQRYGAHAMELLVNALLAAGAQRRRLQAKLFGGARMLKGLTDVGAMNAAFAEQYLRREGITYLGGSLGGERGRRVQFWPVSGRARQIALGGEAAAAFEQERRAPVVATPPAAGALELF